MTRDIIGKVQELYSYQYENCVACHNSLRTAVPFLNT